MRAIPKSCSALIALKGSLQPTGVSTLQVHGIFAIHGAEHEMTIPVRVETSPGHWTANFTASPFPT